MLKAKILVLGPCESGKTTIANFLSDATETFGGDYHPTQGVRIVEFECPGAQTGKRASKIEVELWDCSGDHKFEGCWPAIARDVHGIIFVFNPDQPNYDKDLEQWFKYFADQQGLRQDQCILFAHRKTGGESPRRVDLTSSMQGIDLVHTNLDDDAEQLREDFHMFMRGLAEAMTKHSEQEELSIMNSRG